jgi:hypothetical protein
MTCKITEGISYVDHKNETTTGVFQDLPKIMWVTLIKWYDRGLDAGTEGMHVLWIANKDASRFTVSSLGDGIA